MVSFETILEQIERGEVESLFVLNGDPSGWISSADLGKLDQLKLLIVQDLLKSDANAKAHFLLSKRSLGRKGWNIRESSMGWRRPSIVVCRRTERQPAGWPHLDGTFRT